MKWTRDKVQLGAVGTDQKPASLGPMRRLLGLTWIGWLNFLVLRWFFVRLFYVVESDGTISRWGLTKWVWPIPWSTPRRVGGGR